MKTKKLLIVAALFFWGSITNIWATEKLNYFGGTLSEALEAAAKQNKNVFLKTYTDWCGYCKQLDSKVLSNSEVINYLNKNYISLKVDAEKGEGIEIAKKYRVKGFPTMLILNPKGKIERKIEGYRDIDGLLKELEYNKK